MADQGVDQLRALSRRLKEFGDRGLQREFTREITAVMKPLRKVELPQSAMEVLPNKGGLNRRVAKTVFRIQKKTGLQQAGIRLNARYMYNILKMDNPGWVRHPVFKRRGEEGRRTVWVTQRITPGWFTRPTDAARPRVQRGMTEAMNHMARQIDGAERARDDGSPLI